MPKVVDLLQAMQNQNPPPAAECLSIFNEAIQHLTTENLDIFVDPKMWRLGA